MDEEEDAEEAEAGVLGDAFGLVMSTSCRRYSVLLPILDTNEIENKTWYSRYKEEVFGFLGPRASLVIGLYRCSEKVTSRYTRNG